MEYIDEHFNHPTEELWKFDGIELHRTFPLCSSTAEVSVNYLIIFAQGQNVPQTKRNFKIQMVARDFQR